MRLGIKKWFNVIFFKKQVTEKYINYSKLLSINLLDEVEVLSVVTVVILVNILF